MSDQAAQLLGKATLNSPLELLLSLSVLALIPVLAIATTSFTRIVVVLSLLRTSLGSPALPPNSVVIALALLLTSAVMAPTLQQIDHQAVAPFGRHQITPSAALERAAAPLEAFMARQARTADIVMFARATRVPISRAKPPFSVLAPAFLVGELRTAFAMGFALALPFVVIDLVVATALMSLGMFMVPPATIALPLKLLLFVVADGWALVVGALMGSFH